MNSLAEPSQQKDLQHKLIRCKTFSPNGSSPNRKKLYNSTWDLGNNIRFMAEELIAFYKLLKAELPTNITTQLQQTIESVNRAVKDACGQTLKQPYQENNSS